MSGMVPTALSAASYAVRTSGLTKRFGRHVAVSDVSLTLPTGSVYVLIGPNGAGKTTTFRMLLGLLTPDGGEAEVNGLAVSPAGGSRASLGYVPENRALPYTWLRVRDVLSHHSRYFPTWDAAYATRLIEAMELRMDAKFGKLSKGEARRVELTMALAHRPRLLMLDEPTDGLDPVIRSTVLSLLAEHMTESETSMLIATHLVYEMERFADHVGVMRKGKLVAQMDRVDMQTRLRRYLLDVPESWSAPNLPLTILKQNGTPRERRWTIWGDEAEVTSRLIASGANVRAATPLTLEEAALALLSEREGA